MTRSSHPRIFLCPAEGRKPRRSSVRARATPGTRAAGMIARAYVRRCVAGLLLALRSACVSAREGARERAATRSRRDTRSLLSLSRARRARAPPPLERRPRERRHGRRGLSTPTPTRASQTTASSGTTTPSGTTRCATGSSPRSDSRRERADTASSSRFSTRAGSGAGCTGSTTPARWSGTRTLSPGETHRQQTFETHPWTFATVPERRRRRERRRLSTATPRRERVPGVLRVSGARRRRRRRRRDDGSGRLDAADHAPGV